jgi:hypothetical protein
VNERIRELAQQHLVHERFSRYGQSVQEDYYEFYPDELAEFVQVIVQECVNALYDNELGNRHISHALKEHFGA